MQRPPAFFMKRLIYLLLLFSGQLLAQPTYFEVTGAAGIANLGEKNHGVLSCDFDRDGDQDLFFLTRTGSNKLHENIGNGYFREISSFCGLGEESNTRAAAWGDFNNDSWPDLYLGNYQKPDQIFMNLGPNAEGQIHFSDQGSWAGILNINEPRSVNLADVNLDGLLDIYVSNYQAGNVLWLNQGNFKFENGTRDSGLSGPGFSMGAIFFDYDQDSDPDLYLTHDFLEPNRLYENDGSGHFVDVAPQLGLNIAAHGMGVDVADVNRDGWLDIYVTDLNENFMMIRQADGTFQNESATLGIADPGMGWSTCFLDADLDGLMDLYVVNDSRFSPFPNQLYLQTSSGQFVSGDYSSPLCSSGSGIGGTVTDLNSDGFPDIVIANSFPLDGNQLFLNKGNGNHWIGVKLSGTLSNRDAIGSRVDVTYANGLEQTQEVIAGSGYASQHSGTLYFGIGQHKKVEQMTIIWPGGKRQELHNPRTDTVHSIREIGFETAKNNLSLFPISPNPVTDRVRLRLQPQVAGVIHVTLLDLRGRTVREVEAIAYDQSLISLEMNLSPLSSGMYILTASLNDGISINQPFIYK